MNVLFNYLAGFFLLLALVGHIIQRQINLLRFVAIYQKRDDSRSALHIVKDDYGCLHTVHRLPHDLYDYLNGEKVIISHFQNNREVVCYLDGPATKCKMVIGLYMMYTGLVGFIVSAVIM